MKFTFFVIPLCFNVPVKFGKMKSSLIITNMILDYDYSELTTVDDVKGLLKQIIINKHLLQL